MRYTNTSWFPLKNFCKSEIKCHRDYMMGCNNWKGLKDSITNKVIKPLTTVFWNRELNINISLDTYNRIIKEKNPVMLKKLSDIGLPLDIRV